MQYDERPTGNSTMRRQRMSKRQRKREMMRHLLPPLIAIVLIIIVITVAFFSGMLDNLKYSSKKADLYEHFNISDDSEAIVVRYNEVTEDRLPVVNGTVYVPLSGVNEEFNDRFYYDEESGSYIYTRGDTIDKASVGSRTITYKGADQTLEYDPLTMIGDSVYMALDYLKMYKTFDYSLFGGNGQPYRIWLSTEEDASSVTTDTIKKAQAVRTGEDKKSDILKELEEGDKVFVLEKGEEWSKVETDDFITGYIENKFLSGSPSDEPITRDANDGSIEDLAIASTDMGKPVILAWHNTVGNSGSESISSILADAGGINVISPTWFTVTDDNGNIDSIGSREYVDICHNKGVQVWGVFDNLQHLEVSSLEIFSKASKRAKLISQLIGFAHEYGLDGINVDVESIPTESGIHFAQFIRELSMECRKDGIILSVDNYVPMGFNDHYNRAEQGVYADYVIIMGYDEHYSGSKEAGSVASIGYVRSGIENTVAMVPSSKVINAVPLYTRLWIETPKTEEEIEDEKLTFDEEGNEIHTEEEDIIPYTLEIQTLKMGDGITTANANGTVSWDEETAQNYATWQKGGKTYEIWLEDKDSLEAKLKVMQENNLAGVAAWQVAYADSYVWDLFKSYY